MILNRTFRVLLVLFLFLEIPAWAEEKQDLQVTVTPSRSYKLRKFFLTPLELPSYATQVAVWPFGLAGRWIERNHMVERTIDLLSNDDRTFWVYPLLEAGAGSGVGGGLGLHHSNFLGKGYSLDSRYVIFGNLGQHGNVLFNNPHALTLWDRNAGYRVEFDFSWRSRWHFFGVGPDSLASMDSRFALNEIREEAEFDLPLPYHLHIKPHIGLRTAEALGINSPDSIEAAFPGLDGFDRWLTHFDVGFSITHDTRDVHGQTQRGGVQAFTFRRLQGLGSTGFDYNQYELEIRQYIPLWAERRVLILRNAWTLQQTTGGSAVPFYRLSTLDLDSPLRGFDRGRFRDRGNVVFNAEYRYPVWDIIDATLFVETGRVFPNLGGFTFKDFKYSVGGGVQLVTKNFFIFRLQAASGGEGVNVVFDVSSAL